MAPADRPEHHGERVAEERAREDVRELVVPRRRRRVRLACRSEEFQIIFFQIFMLHQYNAQTNATSVDRGEEEAADDTIHDGCQLL